MEQDLKAQYVQAKKENCGRGPLRTRPVSFVSCGVGRPGWLWPSPLLPWLWSRPCFCWLCVGCVLISLLRCQAKFKYARTLVNSSSREKLQLGASMLQGLLLHAHTSTPHCHLCSDTNMLTLVYSFVCLYAHVSHAFPPVRRVTELVYCGHEISSCLFALALAHYRLGAMKESRKFIEHLLRREPDNKDALVFHRLLRSEVSRGM